MMPYIEGLAAREMGVSVKDRWNPMDVVMTKRSKMSAIKNQIKSISEESLDPKSKLIKFKL